MTSFLQLILIFGNKETELFFKVFESVDLDISRYFRKGSRQHRDSCFFQKLQHCLIVIRIDIIFPIDKHGMPEPGRRRKNAGIESIRRMVQHAPLADLRRQ